MKSLRSTPVQAVSSKYCLTVRGVTAHFYNLCANGKSCVVNDKSIKGLLSLTDGGAPNLCASCTAATVRRETSASRSTRRHLYHVVTPTAVSL